MKKFRYLIFVLALCILICLHLVSCDVPTLGGSGSQGADSSVTSGNESIEGSTPPSQDSDIPVDSSDETTDSSDGVVDSSDGLTDSSDGSADSSVDTSESDSVGSDEITDDSNTDSSDKEEEHKHIFGPWNITSLPKCEDVGLQTRKCKCGEIEEKEIPAVGHSYGKWSETKPATCTEAGEQAQSCFCGDTVTAPIEALGHELNEYGACTRCEYYFAKKAIILSLDISSSMKDILGNDRSHSRFTALLSSLKATLEEMPPDTLVGIIAFDGNLHLVCEPRFLGSAEERQAVISEIEYSLTHTYYRFYLDAQGNETHIPVSQSDGETYTSQGYIKPSLSPDDRDGGYDRANGYWIKTYGTAYLPPITYASQAFDTINAKEKSFIFVSDGEPMDKGSGYLEIIKELADKGIKTSTICLGVQYSQMEELAAIGAMGKGLVLSANSIDELSISFHKVLELFDAQKETDESGFVFVEINGKYYLVGYEGNDTNLVLPNSYNGQEYRLMAGSIDGLDTIHSVTFPGFITEIPPYAITNCKHLYTVKFLAESTVNVNSKAFDGCVRLYESYGYHSSGLPLMSQSNNHKSFEEESFVNILESGLVICKPSDTIFEVLDYLGDAQSIRLEIPLELLGTVPSNRPITRYIANYAFYETNLESIFVENGFTWVGKYAFANSTTLTSIVFEGDDDKTAMYVYEGTFSECPALEFIKLPPLILQGSNTFGGCPRLVMVSSFNLSAIPQSYNPLNRPYIPNCTGFGFAAGGLKWVTTSDYEGVMICGYIGNDEAVTIPSQIGGVNVTRISDDAFAGLDHITSIDIPDSVTSIGKDAFLGCTKLGNVKEGILYLDGWVISYTGDYTEVKIDNEAVGIASHAFYDRDDLITVIMPQSVKYLSKDAVIDCESITVCFECNQEQDTWTQGWNTNNVPVTFNYCAANGHIWNSATCTEPRICSLCGAPTGLPNGHSFENRYCTVCNAIEIFDVTYNEWSGTVLETAVPNEDGTHTLRTGRKSTSNYSGYTFFGWVDDAGNLYAPGETVYFERDTRLYEAYGKTVYTASELTSAITAWSHTFIRLGNDITVTSAISANVTVVFIDLNGYTLTSTSSSEAFYISRGSFALVGEGKFVHHPSSVNTSVSAASVVFRAHGYGDVTYPQVFRIGKDVTFTTPYNALHVSSVILDGTPDILVAGKVNAKALAYISPVTVNALCEITKDATLTLSDRLITFANSTGAGNYMTITIDGKVTVADSSNISIDPNVSDYVTLIDNREFLEAIN